MIWDAETLPPIQTPAPDKSKAQKSKVERSVSVTVEADRANPTKAGNIRMGIENYRLTDLLIPLDKFDKNPLSSALRFQKVKFPDLQVDLRADKRLEFDQVSPVMQAIASAGITTIRMVAEEEKPNP